MSVGGRLLFAVVLGWAVYSGAAMAKDGVTQPVAVAHAEQFILHSVATDRDYLIQVAVPSVPPPKQGYPVLYVLDGNAYWPLVRLAHQVFARSTPFAEPAPLLIVGVGYPGVERFDFDARADDYTPPVPQTQATAGGRRHGGADRFLTFIDEQLKPAINARYAIDPVRRSILGHSFGGLFVLYTLLQQPQAFERYFAISPSLWWGDDYLPQALDELASAATMNERCVFIGVGGLEQTPSAENRSTPRGKLVRDRAMVDNARQLAKRLQDLFPRLATTFEVFPGERHGTIMWPAVRQVLSDQAACAAKQPQPGNR